MDEPAQKARASRRRIWGSRTWLAGLAPVLAVAIAAPVAISSGTRVTARDRAATHAYLEAELRYEQALVANVPASKASLEALASKLDAECPGVLAGGHPKVPAPRELPRSRKQDGEEDRKRRQWSDLTEELNRAITLSRDAPYREAKLTLARQVRALRWSNRVVTAYVHASAAAIESEVQNTTPPPVCADMKSWVASGYRTLTASTKALASEREAISRPIERILKRLPEATLILEANPVSGYEGSAARVLARKITELEKRNAAALKSISDVGEQVRITLGVITAAELRKVLAESGEAPRATREARKPWPTSLRSVPTVASGHVPNGPGFSITATRRASPRSNISLEVELTNENEAGGMQREEGEIGAAFPPRHGHVDPLIWQLKSGCQPHEFAIFYGMLKTSEDSVLVRESGALKRLRRVRIPASMHVHGVLAYIVLPTAPSEVLVRKPHGKSIFAEKLVGVRREARETCEGEAEGPIS